MEFVRRHGTCAPENGGLLLKPWRTTVELDEPPVAASYHVVLRCQAADHYWTMQCLETLVFVVAAVVLGVLSYFWVRRKIA